MLAYQGIWLEKPDAELMLQAPPTVGVVYNIQILTKLPVPVDVDIWIYYELPDNYYNGYEQPEGFAGIRFCRGMCRQMLGLTGQWKKVTIAFEVQETRTLQDFWTSAPIIPFLKRWEDIFMSHANNLDAGDGFSVEKIGDYLRVGCGGGQGAFQQTCIVQQIEQRLYAAMVEIDRDGCVCGGKFELSASLQELILEEIDVVYKVWNNRKIFLRLRSSDYYQTPERRQWCIDALTQIQRRIVPDGSIRISGPHYPIDDRMLTQTDFLQWLEDKFKGGFEASVKQTGFNILLSAGNIEEATILMSTGLDINSADERGIYPIACAIGSENPDVLRFLILHGADVNVEMDYEVNLYTGKRRPLHMTIETLVDNFFQHGLDVPYPKDINMVQLLLNNGAELHLLDSLGMKPLDVLNGYGPNLENFLLLKGFLRPIIPDIDTLIQFKKRY